MKTHRPSTYLPSRHILRCGDSHLHLGANQPIVVGSVTKPQVLAGKVERER
jgi:hypothetical protein